MNTLELLKTSGAGQNDFSEFNQRGKNILPNTSKIFEQLHTYVDLVLRYKQRSINEFSNLREGHELKIETCQIEVLNNYNTESRRGAEMGYFDELNIPVDVAIGQIELSVADLLAIEKGEFLTSKLPPQSKVALIIAGEKIAEASFEIADEMIILKINEIFMKNNNDSNDNKVVTAV